MSRGDGANPNRVRKRAAEDDAGAAAARQRPNEDIGTIGTLQRLIPGLQIIGNGNDMPAPEVYMGCDKAALYEKLGKIAKAARPTSTGYAFWNSTIGGAFGVLQGAISGTGAWSRLDDGQIMLVRHHDGSVRPIYEQGHWMSTLSTRSNVLSFSQLMNGETLEMGPVKIFHVSQGKLRLMTGGAGQLIICAPGFHCYSDSALSLQSGVIDIASQKPGEIELNPYKIITVPYQHTTFFSSVAGDGEVEAAVESVDGFAKCLYDPRQTNVIDTLNLLPIKVNEPESFDSAYADDPDMLAGIKAFDKDKTEFGIKFSATLQITDARKVLEKFGTMANYLAQMQNMISAEVTKQVGLILSFKVAGDNDNSGGISQVIEKTLTALGGEIEKCGAVISNLSITPDYSAEIEKESRDALTARLKAGQKAQNAEAEAAARQIEAGSKAEAVVTEAEAAAEAKKLLAGAEAGRVKALLDAGATPAMIQAMYAADALGNLPKDATVMLGSGFGQAIFAPPPRARVEQVEAGAAVELAEPPKQRGRGGRR